MKLNLGCGKDIREGWINVDTIEFEGVDVACNLGEWKWPWENDSIEEVHCSHMIEHLTATQRIHFINELYRVLQKDRGCMLIAPHWASCRAYGDLTHQWPPISEFWFYYLSKDWRAGNAPHSTYNKEVDFACTWGYSLRPDIQVRNVEFQQFAHTNYKDVVQDIHATLIKK